MFLECCICGSQTEISKKDKKYIIESEEFTCSLECIKEWVLRNCNHKFDPYKEAELISTVFMCQGESNKISYKSEYERYFAFYISNIIRMSFGYEVFGFKLSTGTYTPDFWLTANVFIEVKGLIGTGFRNKLKRFREEYPEVKLLVIPWVLKDNFYRLPVGGIVK